MILLIPIFLNILLTIILLYFNKINKFKNLSLLYKQVIIGFLFGIVSTVSSEIGINYLDIIVNIRDASPICAGLIFGPIAGIIAGFIGGIYRAVSIFWGAGTYTVVACSISTIMAGIIVAILRKFIFDDKRPNLLYGLGITIFIEIFHMLMIFVTNMGDANTAFLFVQKCTLPMIIANGIAVVTSMISAKYFSKEDRINKDSKSIKISHIFEKWIFIFIFIGFIISSSFIYNLQEKMTKLQIEETFTVTINDVYKDIKDKSDDSLLEKTKLIKNIYLQDKTKSLKEIALENNVIEINIVQDDGLIKNSTQDNLIDSYNMNDSDQSKEFMVLVTDDVNEFVQDFRAVGSDGVTMRKFAGVTLEEGGFIQVGYNTEQFRDNLDNFVIDVTKNRKVGATGFIAVCDENLKLVTSTNRNGNHISSLGLEPNGEMNSGLSASKIYKTEIKNSENDYKEKYIYVFSFVENYCIIAAIPEVEAMLMRDASIYLNSFSLIILLTMLFIVIYYLVKKIIIKNINQINDSLKKITNGDLSVVIENHSSYELEFLASGINSTVDSLNRYIKEANERIDQELEYAKEIQKSALPKNFMEDDDCVLFADMIPAKEVGGDFYDFYKLGDNKIAFLVADVSGKGIPAAMFMMKAKIIIKDLAESGLSIEEIFSITNEKLCENNITNMFVTAWMGILDLDTKILEFANAGHNPPIIFSENKYKVLKSKPDFVLGGMEGIKYKSNKLNLKDGDKIFIYTDGVIDAINKEKESYGEDRLIEFLNKNKDNHSNELLVRLKEDIDDFANTEPQFDDITMLYFELKEKTALEKMINEKTFLADDSNLENVFNFVEDSLENINISNKIVNSLNLAVEEIFVNISHYGYENNQGTAKIEIYFEENLNQIKIKIIDNGKPFNPLLKSDPDITLTADERDIGGLGIFITKKLMDEIFYEYKDSQNILTLIKKI